MTQQRNALRIYPGRGLEVRQAEEDPSAGAALAGNLIFEGYSAITEHEYPVYGGEWPGWYETMAAGAFSKTLSEGADVAFLVNHTGMTLARTKAGTLDLAETDVGEHVLAHLDSENPAVKALESAVTRGDVDEMSIAFRVVRDEWVDEDGEPADLYTGTRRRILEVNQDKGDVSAVNYGANDATSIMARDAEVQLLTERAGAPIADPILAELRAGHPLTTDQAMLLRASLTGPAASESSEELVAVLEAQRRHWYRRHPDR